MDTGTIIRSVLLFAVAGICEIAGGYLVRYPPFGSRSQPCAREQGSPSWLGQGAARQGGDAADRFRFLLQAAFHVHHLDIRQPGVLEGFAREARLDMARFESDRHDTTLLSEVGRSHREAVERYGVFGTPTLVFPNGRAAYTKLADAPLETASSHLFEHLRELVEQHHVLQGIKFTQSEGA